MTTRMVTQRELEAETSRMSHSMQLSSNVNKKTFTSSEEEASYSDFYPIISGDVMSAVEILNLPQHRTWEILKYSQEHIRNKWTLFGNEAEKFELGLIQSQRVLRSRVDRIALRRKAEEKSLAHVQFLERLSVRSPDFPIPLRAHTVWEGMAVTLTCTVQGRPPPKVTWYKDGVALRMCDQPWNYSLLQTFGLNSLEIRRCSPKDAGEYKVIAKSPLGEATTFATLVVNSYLGAVSGSDSSKTYEREAEFCSRFPPTWVTESDPLTLSCSFTPPLLPFQQDVTWFRDGVQLHPSSCVDIRTVEDTASISLKAVYKEHEGFYTIRLKTRDGVKEHRAFVYVEDAPAVVLGGPGSPLLVQVCNVNRDYVFLTWNPPSADGLSPVEGYYVDRLDVSEGVWVRCNSSVQRMCHYPVFGLKEGATYQFRVCAVNRAGVSRPSKVTHPVVTADPLNNTRTMVVKVDKGKTVTITKDELEGEVKVPLAPTDVKAYEVSDSYVVLSWTQPEPRGREPLNYYVERCVVGQSSWTLASLDCEVNSPRFPVFDLVKGKLYRFRVRSVNKYGVSDPSDPSDPIGLAKPRAAPAPPTSVMATRDSDSAVLLQWAEPNDKQDVVGYYLYSCECGQQDWKTVNNKPITGTRFTVDGLKKGKKYVFRVKSVSPAGNSQYSDESEPVLVKAAISVPSAPSSIALLLCTASEMVLGWRAPAHSGGNPVHGYYLDQREQGLNTWSEVNVKPVKERQIKVSNLTGGNWYQFRVFAANVAGVGKASDPSDSFLCEEWTMAQPGPPYDAEVREVKGDSLVLLWAPPLYQGANPVTGYFLEISQGDQSDDWIAVNKEPITDTHYKVCGLQTGQTYRLRVVAVNAAGSGRASLPTEPVTAQTKPGSRDIEIGVDEDGFIFLDFEAEDVDEDSKFLWNRNYKEPIDSSRARAENKEQGSVLTFADPSEEDLGLYTVEKSDDPQQSSSYDFTEDDLKRLKELSWKVRNPLISLKSGWNVEVSEVGEVRLWLQTESLSDEAELRLIFNDQEITSTPHRRINFLRSSGLVEIVFDRLGPEDEGSYTAQLKDGRAKNQFTLVFVDKKFRETLALAEKKRRDHQRKFGPYFQDYLSWSVNADCELIIKCKVTNTNKDTTLKWFKEDKVVTKVEYEEKSGESFLTIPQLTKSDAGSYRVVVSDKRGEDVSTLELKDDEWESVLQQLSKQCALSAGPLKVQATAEGFKLFCSLKYFISSLKTSWNFKEKRMDADARKRPGSNMDTVWIIISNPTDSDKGKYTLEMFDGKETHKRSLDLSGQVFADVMQEHQRLKQAAIAEKNRAKVLKGLPDVVAIMEGKSLCLTCFIDGDPAPEVSWLRNDKEIFSQNQFSITREPKVSTITINNVNTEDSGKFSIHVSNKFGSETVDVTVSVYKHGEKPPAHAVDMGF